MTVMKVPSEGGSGGRRGHSNMEHWAETDEIKFAARRRRRGQDREEARRGLLDHLADVEADVEIDVGADVGAGGDVTDDLG